MNIGSPDMSKKDSRKGLKSVYRRCLSALHPSFKYRLPSLEKCKRIEARIATEASDKEFAKGKEREAWVRGRFNELYQEERLRLLKNPLEDLRAQISSMMD